MKVISCLGKFLTIIPVTIGKAVKISGRVASTFIISGLSNDYLEFQLLCSIVK